MTNNLEVEVTEIDSSELFKLKTSSNANFYQSNRTRVLPGRTPEMASSKNESDSKVAKPDSS